MRTGHLRGIAAMLVAVAAFAAMDAVLKVLAGRYPPMQVSALRGASSLPFVLAAVALLGRWRDLRAVNVRLHLARGVLGVVMIGGFVYALRSLSLADAYSVFFVAPLLVTALAVPLLGERVDWRRWVAIASGLAGVLAMLRPSAGLLGTLGAVAALVSALAYALSAISVRFLTRTDTTQSMVFWFLVALTVACGILAAPGWLPIERADWPWIVALGAIGSVGQHLITEAFRHAPASVIAPFEYTALLWGVAIDWAFWQVLPGAQVFYGGGLVITAGLYLIWRERRLHRELAASIESPASPH
ncbi:MAG: DMT family transporter [Gammaproteobacteria bacterium]|nr:DMT family transporter [Gammaproteobacteria bacterium]